MFIEISKKNCEKKVLVFGISTIQWIGHVIKSEVNKFWYRSWWNSCIYWYFQQLLPTDKIRSVWLMKRGNEKGDWKLKKPWRRLKRENASARKQVVFIKHLISKALVLLAASTKITNKNTKNIFLLKSASFNLCKER